MSPAPRPLPIPIYVTKPALPALSSFYAHLEEIWQTRVLSNHGPKHRQLETMLLERFQVSDVKLFCNGTLALTLALQAFEVRGEVLTTPFTFPATTHAIALAGAKPAFCDVDPSTLCIDLDSIERMIRPDTQAIVGVHVYGIPCNVAGIERIARAHGLKVIYDAAHAFTTRIDGRPIAQFGDATMFSFHATKLFHTVEGGCIALHDNRVSRKLDLLRNFGILDEETVDLIGTNAKLNEIQAAMGIEMLKIVDVEQTARAKIKRMYATGLSQVEGIEVLTPGSNVSDSLQYMAIRVKKQRFGMDRNQLHVSLREWNIFTRKYFFPMCSDFSVYRSHRRDDLSQAEIAAQEVLCLPFYGELPLADVGQIIEVITHLHRLAQTGIRA